MFYRYILKYTSLLGSVQVLNVLLNVLRNKAAAVFIGAMGMGLVAVYSNIIELMSGLSNFGLGISGVRTLSVLYESGRERELRHEAMLIRTWIFLGASGGTLLTMLLAPLLIGIFDSVEITSRDILLLSPAVGLSVLSLGETIILRSAQRLKTLAWISFGIVAFGALISILLYASWGLAGIIPVILLTALATLGLFYNSSRKVCRYRICPLRWRLLSQGLPAVRLGIAFVGASVFYSLICLLINSTLSLMSDIATLGLYSVGLTLTVSYARIIFSSMDSVYFPRLSVVAADGKGDAREQNELINTQIDVLVQIVTPFLLLMALCLPLLVHLLYTDRFLDVLPMVWVALPSMFFKAMYTPVAYLSLAKSKGRIYATMEVIFDVLFGLLVIVGFHLGGLLGAGIGISLAHLSDLLLLNIVYRRQFSFRLTPSTLRLSLIQGTLLAIGLSSTLLENNTARLVTGATALLLSALLGLGQMLRKAEWHKRSAK